MLGAAEFVGLFWTTFFRLRCIYSARRADSVFVARCNVTSIILSRLSMLSFFYFFHSNFIFLSGNDGAFRCVKVRLPQIVETVNVHLGLALVTNAGETCNGEVASRIENSRVLRGAKCANKK